MSDTQDVSMKPFRRPGAVRSMALIACLGLFLAGSNYCLLTGWSGIGDMACLTMPVPQAGPPACGKCAGHGEDKPKTAQRSCCPAPVVAPSAPALDKADAPAAVLFTLATVAPSAPALASHRGLPAASESPPPARLVRAPLPARAPPLA
jgi:hypothetical protein